jgi:hypothetical protein
MTTTNDANHRQTLAVFVLVSAPISLIQDDLSRRRVYGVQIPSAQTPSRDKL